MFNLVRNLRNRKRKGMTLIELMIVVVIIGIVFAYAFINAGANTEKAKYARAEEDISALASAVALKFAQDGDSATTLVAANFAADSTYFDGKLSKAYANMIDPWGTQYSMVLSGKKVTITCSKATNPYSNPAGQPLKRVLDFTD